MIYRALYPYPIRYTDYIENDFTLSAAANTTATEGTAFVGQVATFTVSLPIPPQRTPRRR